MPAAAAGMRFRCARSLQRALTDACGRPKRRSAHRSDANRKSLTAVCSPAQLNLRRLHVSHWSAAALSRYDVAAQKWPLLCEASAESKRNVEGRRGDGFSTRGEYVNRKWFLVSSILAAGCDNDSATSPSSTSGMSTSGMSSLCRAPRASPGEPRRIGRGGGDVPALGSARRASRTDLARISERGARSGEWQSAGARAQSHREWPWRNINNVVVANNLTELHTRSGDASVFVDEMGRRINGQWTGSPRRSSTTS